MDKEDDFWNDVLWSDEIKIELLVIMTKSMFGRKLNKHSILRTPYQLWSMVEETLWGCFASTGTGELACLEVDGIMKKKDYLKTLQQNLQLSVTKLLLLLRWTFQHDNIPKHSAKIFSECLEQNKIKGHWRRKFLLQIYLMLTYGTLNFIFSHVYCIQFVRKWKRCSTLVRHFGSIPRMLIYARINFLTSLAGFCQYNDISYLALNAL